MILGWLSNKNLMTIRWLSDDYPMTIQSLSDNYPVTIQWLPRLSSALSGGHVLHVDQTDLRHASVSDTETFRNNTQSVYLQNKHRKVQKLCLRIPVARLTSWQRASWLVYLLTSNVVTAFRFVHYFEFRLLQSTTLTEHNALIDRYIFVEFSWWSGQIQ